MLNKLRNKLTFMCALITTSVLTLTVIVLFIFSRRELNLISQHALESELNTILNYLQSTSSNYSNGISTSIHTINHSWLFRLEIATDSVIYLQENHHPLLYSGVYKTSTDRHALVELALDKAINVHDFNYYDYSSLNTTTLNSLFFEIRPNSKEHYFVVTTSISLQNTNYQVIVLKDMHSNDIQILRQLLIYLLFSLVSVFLLTLFSFWFANHAILPIVENEKRQKEFVAAASHELRSPLTVLNANSSALAREYPMIKNSFFYTSIKTECIRMTHLISDLLLLSHADTASHWSLECQSVHPDTFLLNIYESFEASVTSHSHHLKIIFPSSDMPLCLLDVNRLTQVFGILIDNAIDYTPEGSNITLSLSLPDLHTICFTVADDGPGISSEHKAHVFERFYRIDSSRSQKEHSGLGLSIAYEIIALHHGRIELKDTVPHGCTFQIYLPY